MATSALQFSHVTLGYENIITTSDLNLTIPQGDYLCIIGENGSGKSTFVKNLLGLLKPLSGEIALTGDWKRRVNTQDEIGYLSASLNYMSSQLKDMEDYQKKFVANVSHDFRSPLTSIKGYVEAMADGTIPPEMQGKYLNIILFETERLTDLTRDLLTLNEFDTKDLLLNKTDFDIHEVIRNTAASFEGSLPAPGGSSGK